MAIVGFSRGGLLAFMASTQRRDLNAVVLILYPSYGRDGHRVFFEVRQTYWRDVEKFLKSELDGG